MWSFLVVNVLAESIHLRLFFMCPDLVTGSVFEKTHSAMDKNHGSQSLKPRAGLQDSSQGEKHTRQKTSNFWYLMNICKTSFALCSGIRKQVLFLFILCLYCSWEEWTDNITKLLTNIARSPAGCGHHISFTLHLWQSEVTDHDFWLFILAIVKQVLRLERRTNKMGFEHESLVITSVGLCVAFNRILSYIIH